MTDEKFVKCIYPSAYFTRGAIRTNTSTILWQDEYGWWSEDWDDQIATKNAWHEMASKIKQDFLHKLES